MKKQFMVLSMFVLLGGLVFSGGQSEISGDDALDDLLALELGTYEPYYGDSDPTEYAALFADEATYFDPWVDAYHEDAAITESLMAWKGRIPNLEYELLNPRVDLYGDTAVLVFNLECSDPESGQTVVLWRGTTVFTRAGGSWEKVHAHWSTTPPPPEG